MLKVKNEGRFGQAIGHDAGVFVVKSGADVDFPHPLPSPDRIEHLRVRGVTFYVESEAEGIDALRSRAQALGIDVKPQWGIPALTRAIETAESSKMAAA